MGIRKYKPIAPGHHPSSVSDFVEITRDTPGRSPLHPLHKTGGHNNNGRMTSRHHGDGHKRQYRVIDFHRHDKDGVPATVTHIEHDPSRATRIAFLHYADGEKRYTLAPTGLRQDDQIEAGVGADVKPGNSLQLRNIPLGTVMHAVELYPGGGAKIVRSAGTSVQLVTKEGRFTQLRMPSGEIRSIEATCRTTIGEVGNAERSNTNWGKAGRMRRKGKRPYVRGIVINPVDHPYGSGEGRTSGGRHPVSPWSKPEGRTCRPKKASDRMIVRRHKTGRNR